MLLLPLNVTIRYIISICKSSDLLSYISVCSRGGMVKKNMKAFYGKKKQNVTIYSCIFLMSSGGRQFIVTCKIC